MANRKKQIIDEKNETNSRFFAMLEIFLVPRLTRPQAFTIQTLNGGCHVRLSRIVSLPLSSLQVHPVLRVSHMRVYVCIYVPVRTELLLDGYQDLAVSPVHVCTCASICTVIQGPLGLGYTL